MQNRPQTIQIFLPDGSPTSIREAEITNRLVKAILFPRNKMQEVAKREMVHFTGVYFLFGNTEDGTKPLVYIGEGEDCFKRIQSHNRNKDFWTQCVIITTKTDEYTKTDGKYLEHYCLDKAKEIGRYIIDNDAGSKKPSISESREYDLLDNFDTAKILLATLGYPIFEEKRKAKSAKELFYCKGTNNGAAIGELTDDGFLVYKDGTASIEETKSMTKWIGVLRNRLVAEGILKEENNVYVFQQDYIFNSPTAAAATIIGRNTNGWTKWKDKNGKTLDELKRQN
ncbi:GIY-YIG nuclease family protein [Kordia sp. YSTF-M3]|uniref:GIY-YIG nuclease family protein n=1 Tax=Kordia aestuariivivens TaxID=2759037 RepID=A0ABR7QDM8_9FLAO|nr:GIY-YIG nuclease family protein [Kordia aestuariivivens]MBC8756424.1 GIY-YIG nuclease family protein [Kordia aestuariivivens]